jgi:hypothetical protein
MEGRFSKQASRNTPLGELDESYIVQNRNLNIHGVWIFIVGCMIGMYLQPKIGVFSTINEDISKWKTQYTGILI